MLMFEQKTTKFCKAIVLQLKNKKKKKLMFSNFSASEDS